MKITIPTPCHENWKTMTPEEKGRFCSVCSKTVRDFTIASDEEIINVFSNVTEEICGNFYKSQLNRNLQYSYINSVLVKFAVGFILTTGGLISVQAQQNIPKDTLQVEKIDEVVKILPEFGKRSTKQTFVGSTTVVSEAELMKAQNNDSKVEALKVTDLQINQRPQRSVNDVIRIGGASSSLRENQKPLVVLDGKIVNLENLQQIDPNSIETMNILKGSSATALYGAIAQNGVIVVTTKKKWKAKNKLNSQ
jgi:TonB-dependent SusC/RagA subfamily outer membrane receptor